ncbi:MAG TPA: hypothetical protein VFI25_05340 [Planctomycetota bacterium]|jgi:hypothetical protein|nr:hypothetical protein [Planctomycetota bacterium]
MTKLALLAAGGLLALFANAASAQVIFSENFEAGGLGVYTETLAGVPAATLWHGEAFCDGVTAIPASMGTNAAAYNQGDLAVYDYATGVANSGEIESPAIPTPGSGFVSLAFEYTKQTEGGGTGTFDQCFVEVASGGGPYAVLGQVTGNSVCPTSTSASMGPTAVGGATWTHRFRFNTVDGTSNNYQGWNVDNVVATALPPLPPPFFTENFEAAAGTLGVYVETTAGGVPAATQWHGEAFCDGVTAIPASMGTNAAAYNQGDLLVYNYATGLANSGAIETPALATPASLAVATAFEYTKQTEGGGAGAFDQCFVEIQPTGGAFQTAAQIVGNSVCPASTTVSVPPVFIGGVTFKQRFRFDTVDAVGNAYQGWTVDNVALSAGTAAAPGPSYCVNSIAPAFSTISTSVTAVLVHGPGIDDNTSGSFPLPSPFSFFGVPKAAFQVNSNGWLAFDQLLGGGFFTNAPIPTAAAPNDAVYPFWDDLHTGAAGSVYYDTPAGGDLVVEWNTMEQFPFNSSGENATFQLVLHPSPANTVELRYDSATFASGPIVWSASIGVEDAAGGTGKDGTGLGTGNAAFPASDLLLAPQSAGSFTTVPTGCGALTLAANGTPRVGGFVSFELGGVGGVPLIWVGASLVPVLLCPPAGCALGASLSVVLPGTIIMAPIPCNPALVGATLAIQGGDVLGLGGCGAVPFGFPFTVSPTVVLTIG